MVLVEGARTIMLTLQSQVVFITILLYLSYLFKRYLRVLRKLLVVRECYNVRMAMVPVDRHFVIYQKLDSVVIFLWELYRFCILLR